MSLEKVTKVLEVLKGSKPNLGWNPDVYLKEIRVSYPSVASFLDMQARLSKSKPEAVLARLMKEITDGKGKGRVTVISSHAVKNVIPVTLSPLAMKLAEQEAKDCGMAVTTWLNEVVARVLTTLQERKVRKYEQRAESGSVDGSGSTAVQSS